jgi:bifunctional UDP-N-acetylglucosamine pyrophosphorylase/glucosamine-1-phosphate N-acetyltransferase
MKAVILAAGKGTRLRPLTDSTPKPMLPVAGKPLLEWMLERIKEADIKDILIVTNYLEDQIKNYFKDGANLGVNITYQTQSKPLGTANAVYQALEWVRKNSFLCLYGDHYIEEGALKKLIDAHQEEEATVASIKVEDPSQYGAFELKGEKITRVVEKPKKAKNQATSPMSVYTFSPLKYSGTLRRLHLVHVVNMR